MKHIMEHYGTAIITAIVLVALGVTLVAIAKSPWIVEQFKAALTDFMANMNSLNATGAINTIN